MESTTGLIIISKLYQEGKINDEDRERLKDMIFNEDAILLQLLQIYEDEEDLKTAIVKYCKGGAMEMARPAVIDASKGDPNELDQASSPTDNALDMMKRKRLNQLAAREKQHEESGAGVLGISDCDLGQSPQMSKGSIVSKKKSMGKMSPLGGVGSRQLHHYNKYPQDQ